MHRLILLTLLLSITNAVKHENFKTCAQSGFCKRNRDYADRVLVVGPAFSSPYELEANSIKFDNGILIGTIWKDVTENHGGKVELPLKILFLDDGVARVTLDEARRVKGDIELRGGSKARKERYDEAEKWALVGGKNLDKEADAERISGSIKVSYGPSGNQMVIEYKPFKITFLRNNEAHVVLNERNLLNVDHWRQKHEKGEGEEFNTDEDEGTWWEETFGGNTDSKPRGSWSFDSIRAYTDCIRPRICCS